MKQNIILITLGVVLLAAVFFLAGPSKKNVSNIDLGAVSSTPSSEVGLGTKMTMPGGRVSFAYPSSFGLAVSPEQIPVKSYIPPCDSDFDYCAYFKGEDYAGTNFESAGLRIKMRKDLTSENTCLTKQPEGYSGLVPKLGTASKTSVFGPMGNAGAGHYATGLLYRLAYAGSCYEFETRIGETQFANYPPGTIKEFTDQDRSKVEALLSSIMGSVTADGKKVEFPNP